MPEVDLDNGVKDRVREAASLDLDKLRALLPSLGATSLGTAAAATPPGRGKVLKLRLGFNPNSSSVGTTVVVFLWSLVASGAVMALTSAVLAYRFRRKPTAEDAASRSKEAEGAA